MAAPACAPGAACWSSSSCQLRFLPVAMLLAAAAAAVGVVLWGAWQPNGRGGGCCRALVEENGVNRRRNSCLKQLSQERALRAGRAAGHCWEELRGVGGAARVQEARLGAPPSPPSLMAAAILAWGAPGKNGLIRRSSAEVWPKRPYFVPQRMACFAHTSEGSGLGRLLSASAGGSGAEERAARVPRQKETAGVWECDSGA